MMLCPPEHLVKYQWKKVFITGPLSVHVIAAVRSINNEDWSYKRAFSKETFPCLNRSDHIVFHWAGQRKNEGQTPDLPAAVLLNN